MRNISLLFLIYICNYSLYSQTPCAPSEDERINYPDTIIQISTVIDTTITGLIGSFSAAPGDRMSFWVHGMNGNDGSWEKASAASVTQVPSLTNIFPARKLLALSPDYFNTQNSLISAAIGLESKLDIPFENLSFGYPKEDCILIAHSQGAVVSRQLERIWSEERPSDRKYGGMALFGAPNGGSPNAADLEQEGAAFVATMIRDLTSGYLSSITDNPSFVLRALARFTGFHNLQDPLVNFLTAPLTDGILSAATSGLYEELTTGSDELNYLNDPLYNPAVPMVTFFGTKDDEVQTFTLEDNTTEERQVLLFYGLLNWMTTSPNTEDYFAANYDWPFQLQVSNFQSLYYQKVQEENAVLLLLNMKPRCGLWNFNKKVLYELLTGVPATKLCRPFPWEHNTQKSLALIRRFQWQRGYNWFNTANEQWKVLIGAKGVNREIACNCKHEYFDKNSGRTDTWYSVYELSGGNCDVYENWSYDNSNERETITCEEREEGLSYWTKESDGLVLKESVLTAPHVSFVPQEMPKSSHFRMRNDINTQTHLLNLFDGEYDLFFRVDERN